MELRNSGNMCELTMIGLHEGLTALFLTFPVFIVSSSPTIRYTLCLFEDVITSLSKLRIESV
uniref:Ovule protein n=1 Tax=Heterorhabditis bacteriophora TaxID=37862 RepID=A0A1I7WVR6_HETBA